MITRDYLLTILPEIEEFSSDDIQYQVLEADGYDGVVALLSNVRDVCFPAVVIEDRTIGNISIDSGPVDSYSIPLWVMVSNDTTKTRTELFQSAFNMTLKILKLFMRDINSAADLSGWDFARIGYSKRSGPDCYGYEVLMTFRDNIDLSYEQPDDDI